MKKTWAVKKKSLEMRVAELEDKLARLHITEAEIKAHNKVAALLCNVPQPPPPPCVAYCIDTNAFTILDCIHRCDSLVWDDVMTCGGDFGSLGY